MDHAQMIFPVVLSILFFYTLHYYTLKHIEKLEDKVFRKRDKRGRFVKLQ